MVSMEEVQILGQEDRVAELRSLIADIEQLGDEQHTRELSDRVLLAIGWKKIPDPNGDLPWPKWFNPEGKYVCTAVVKDHEDLRPDCLGNLQDATLAVPEGWHTEIRINPVDGGVAEIFDGDPVVGEYSFSTKAGWHKPAARALTLAGLMARLAELENA